MDAADSGEAFLLDRVHRGGSLGTHENEPFGTTGTDAGEKPMFPGPATSSALDRWVTLTLSPARAPNDLGPDLGSDPERPAWPEACDVGETLSPYPDPIPDDRAALSAAIRHVLVTWRAAERDVAAISIDSAEWPSAHVRMTELRVSYHRLFEEYCAPRPGERVG